ncbi:Aspartic protease [Psilocybe cubensis]|uniref:Aspartic protease n=1 Tax=Psilocybe cubensis TaxID=181762 RepID=A0ACB8HAB2_PSICU|nr:Aspartic protease [Psilocybe cubensis]KAH9484945.1 Aspartic protease [Psilocybe cubensis]
MSFWLQRDESQSQPQSDETQGGVLTLGGRNSSLFVGDIDFNDIPVNTPTYWLQAVSAVTVNGQSIAITEATSLAAIDTGTTLLAGPPADVAAIWAAVPGSSPAGDKAPGFYFFPCTTDVSVSFSFGGQSWPIAVQDMIHGTVDPAGTLCVGSIYDLSQGTNQLPPPGSPNWIVGDTFLKNVYTIFRMTPPSVGFAQLSALAGGSDTVSSTDSKTTHSNSDVTTIHAVTKSLMLLLLVQMCWSIFGLSVF